MSGRASAVSVAIERLVLDGTAVAPERVPAVVDELRAELGRLIAERPPVPRAAALAGLPRIALDGDVGAGAAIARALHTGLTGPANGR